MQAFHEGVSVALLNDRAFLRVSGSDATRWLNGMVTNSIQSLQPSQGNYSFLLSAQGRIQGDCTIYREPGDPATFLLSTSADQIDNIQTLLDKFIIMDDVELTPVYEEEQSFQILGRSAGHLLQQLGLPQLSPWQIALTSVEAGNVLLLSGSDFGVPAFELRASQPVVSSLLNRAKELGAHELGADDLEMLRVVSGLPRYGSDIRDRDLPQETNQSHALHFAKGCYLGQEIVERIRSRGQVHRLLSTFTLTGTVPTTPAQLEANGKPAGEITSAVQVGDEIYAIGYARREALEAKQPLSYSGGTARPRTT